MTAITGLTAVVSRASALPSLDAYRTDVEQRLKVQVSAAHELTV